MPEVIADFNKEGVFKFRPPSVTTGAIQLVPKVSQTALLVGVLNTDESTTVPANYVSGGFGSFAPVAALKTTTGVPTDATFTGASPVIPTPPIGSIFYNTADHKLTVRDAAASWLATAALS